MISRPLSCTAGLVLRVAPGDDPAYKSRTKSSRRWRQASLLGCPYLNSHGLDDVGRGRPLGGHNDEKYQGRKQPSHGGPALSTSRRYSTRE